MSSPLHREIEAPPYKVVVNAHPEYRTGAAGNTIDAYRVSVIITRLDGNPVYSNFLMYQIPQGGLYLELQGALKDGERLARQSIGDGFPH